MIGKTAKIEQRFQQLKDQYHDKSDFTRDQKNLKGGSARKVTKPEATANNLLSVNGAHVDITTIKDAEAQKEAQRLLKTWLKTEKEAEMIKNRVNGKKMETFYSDIQCIDTKTPIDAIEKRLNSKDLLKKNHASDLDRKTREGRVDQFIEKIPANKKFEKQQGLPANATYQNKLSVSSTYYQSSTSNNRIADKIQGSSVRNERNSNEKPNGISLKQKNYDYEEDDSYEEIKYEGDQIEEEKLAESTSRELSPYPRLETSTLSNESPPKNETRTPEPHKRTPENERKKLADSQFQLSGEENGWKKAINFEQDKKRIEMTLESMKQKHEESKKALQRFKTEKFFSKIDVILVKKTYKYLKIGFSNLAIYSSELDSKLQKLSKRMKFQFKRRFFYAWKSVHNEGVYEKKRIKEETEAQKENELYEKAVAFRDWVLLNKYFMEGFVKLRRQALREKQFQESQSIIKKKVNNFISTLKEKAVELEHQHQHQQHYSTGVFANIEQVQPATHTENKALRNITNNGGDKKQDIKKKNVAQQSYVSKKESIQSPMRNAGLANSKINDSFGVSAFDNKLTLQSEETFGVHNSKHDDSQAEIEQEDYEEEKLLQQPEKVGQNPQISSPIRSNSSIIKNDIISQSPEQMRARLRSPKRNQTERNDLSRDSRASRSPGISERSESRECSESRERSSSNNRPNLAKHTNDVLEKIEKRAKERKEKNLELKRKHAEAKKQKDLERLQQKDKELEELRQKKLEEKQQLEKKRKEEMEKREKVEKERKEDQIKLNKALIFHKNKLMENYGFKPWKKLFQYSKDRKEEAIDHFLAGVTKRAFRLWKEGVRVIKSEKERILEQKMEKAANHHRLVLITKTFDRFVKYQEESLEYKKLLEAHRVDYLKRSLFKAWYLSLAALRKENIETEERYNKICNRFRFITLGEKAFKIWKNYCLEEKKDRLKKSHKEQMWSKVNMILNEYQQKKKK